MKDYSYDELMLIENHLRFKKAWNESIRKTIHSLKHKTSSPIEKFFIENNYSKYFKDEDYRSGLILCNNLRLS